MKTLMTYLLVLMAMVTSWLGITSPASMPSASHVISGE